ncbi:hypothetical protein FRC06_011427 [Ceratobasidium sp. 370]|nr:hypothetical protein FRC06_011427 [Ceratobasidium sp. 370]
MEDFEGCERVFSHSNGVARCTQHGSKYNRHQQIHQHMEASDRDCLANMGKFIFNKFQNAVTQLEDSTRRRDQAMEAFDLKEEDFPAFVAAELDTRKKADLENKVAELASAPASSFAKPGKSVNIDKVIAAHRRDLTSRLLVVHETICELEISLDVGDRWTPEHPEWQDAIRLRDEQALQACVDNLEHLGVERLLEMEKTLHGGTGYKLREMISKSLATRSEIIRNAIKRYNELASRANPPREQITAKEFFSLSRLSDFKLLRESRSDILSQKWAQPQIREATNHSLRVLRAREELVRLQVEARRLQTWMRDEVHHVAHTLQVLDAENPPLAHVLRNQLDYQSRVNAINLTYIQRIERHSYYNGPTGPGSQKQGVNATGFTPYTISLAAESAGQNVNNDINDSDLDDMDEEMAELAENYDKIAIASSSTSLPGPSSTALLNPPPIRQPGGLSETPLTIHMLPPTVLSHTAAGTVTLIDLDELSEAYELLESIDRMLFAAHRYQTALELGHFAVQPAEGIIPTLATPAQVNRNTVSLELCRLRYLYREEVSKLGEPLDVAIEEIKRKQAGEQDRARQVLDELEAIRMKFRPGGECNGQAKPTLEVVDNYFDGITDDDIHALRIRD